MLSIAAASQRGSIALTIDFISFFIQSLSLLFFIFVFLWVMR